jgi:membrane-bound inhibitor of C-type lysozyme
MMNQFGVFFSQLPVSGRHGTRRTAISASGAKYKAGCCRWVGFALWTETKSGVLPSHMLAYMWG